MLGVLALLLAMVTGLGVARAILSRTGNGGVGFGLELGLALTLGLAIHGQAFFLLKVLGAGGLVPVLVLDLALATASVIAWRWRAKTRPASSPQDFTHDDSPLPRPIRWALWAVVLTAAAASLAAVLGEFRQNPHGNWDAWAIWNLKARFLVHPAPVWTRAFDPALSWSHTDYPLLLPLNVARLWTYAGSVDPAWSAALSTLVAVATAATLAGAVRRQRGPLLAAAAVLALLASARFRQHAAWQLADLPVALFLLTASAALLESGRDEHNRALLILAGLLVGSAACVKNEGLLMSAAMVLAVAIVDAHAHGWSLARRRIGLLLLGLAAPIAILLGFKWTLAGPSYLFGQTAGDLVGRAVDLERHRLIIAGTWQALHKVAGLPLLVTLLTLLVVSFDRQSWRRPGVRAVALLLLITLAGFYTIYLITPLDLAWQLQTSADRLLLQLWPTILLLLFISSRRVRAA